MTSTSQAIQAQIAQLAADLNKQVAIQNTYAQTGVRGIQGAYRGLDKQLKTNLGEIKGNVKAGRNDINSTYTASGSNIKNAEATVRELLGGGGQVNSGPLAEIQRLAAEQNAAKANSVSSYNMLGLGHTNAGQMAIGDAAQEGATQQSGLRSQIGAEIGELQRTHAKERAAMEVQYAQVLAEEKYRAEQMALERARLASENAARAAAARADARDAAGKAEKYQGREGLMRWMAETGVPVEERAALLAAIAKANQSGDSTTAYHSVSRAHQVKTGGGYRPDKDKGKWFPVYKKKTNNPGYDLNRLNTGLDIYYGNFSGSASS